MGEPGLAAIQDMLLHVYTHVENGGNLIRLARNNGVVNELMILLAIKLLLLTVLRATYFKLPQAQGKDCSIVAHRPAGETNGKDLALYM